MAWVHLGTPGWLWVSQANPCPDPAIPGCRVGWVTQTRGDALVVGKDDDRVELCTKLLKEVANPYCLLCSLHQSHEFSFSSRQHHN